MNTLNIQVFGTKKSTETRKALRFFAERRVPTHFVDLTQRAASPGELRRFVERFGMDALIDRTSKRFAQLGLAHVAYGADRWITLLADEPLLLRQPLVRNGKLLAIGDAEDSWKEWLAG